MQKQKNLNPANLSNMEANSKEWFDFRAGKFTASEFHKLMGEKGGVNTQTAQTYILEKVAATLNGGWVEPFDNNATRWGKDLEPDAVLYYEYAFGVTVEKPDPQCAEWSDEVSGSMDGLVYTDKLVYGIECKCPYNPVNHVRNMLIRTADDFKKTSKEYYWQVMGYMMIFNLPYIDFVSYDPRMTGSNRMHTVEIRRNESDIALLKENLLLAVQMKHDFLKRIEM